MLRTPFGNISLPLPQLPQFNFGQTPQPQPQPQPQPKPFDPFHNGTVPSPAGQQQFFTVTGYPQSPNFVNNSKPAQVFGGNNSAPGGFAQSTNPVFGRDTTNMVRSSESNVLQPRENNNDVFGLMHLQAPNNYGFVSGKPNNLKNRNTPAVYPNAILR